MTRRSELKTKLAALLAAGAGSALIATAVLPAASAQAAPTSADVPVIARADNVRAQLERDGIRSARRDGGPLQLAWWGNWHNGGWSPYWHNWPNWRNWHNWGNGWGNGGCLPF